MQRSVAVAALLGAVVLWSASLSLVRVVVDDVSPGSITFWRCAVGAGVLVAWVAARRAHRGAGVQTGRAHRASWTWAAASGASCGAAFLLVAFGMREVGSGPAGIVLSSIPGLTLLLAAIGAQHPTFGGRQLSSLGIGLLAAATLALPAAGGWNLTGLVVLALAAFAHAVTNVTSSRSLARLDPVVVAAAAMVVAAVMTAPFASFDGPLPSLPTIVAISALGVFPTGLAYVMYFHGVRVLGITSAAFSNFLVPPTAVVVGAVALGEAPDGATLLALVLAMVALAVGLGGRPVGLRDDVGMSRPMAPSLARNDVMAPPTVDERVPAVR